MLGEINHAKSTSNPCQIYGERSGCIIIFHLSIDETENNPQNNPISVFALRKLASESERKKTQTCTFLGVIGAAIYGSECMYCIIEYAKMLGEQRIAAPITPMITIVEGKGVK